jgi:hypothetical protein
MLRASDSAHTEVSSKLRGALYRFVLAEPRGLASLFHFWAWGGSDFALLKPFWGATPQSRLLK